MPWAEESRSIYDHVARFVSGIMEGAPPLDPAVVAALPGS